MRSMLHNTPVEDSVPKVNNEVAVGEDPEFQKRWWKFENAVWSFFLVIVLLDLLGLFGRGALAKAHKDSGDGAVDVTYERIERTGTPSVLRVKFGDAAIHNQQIKLWANEELVTGLGNKQIAPQPASSVIGQDGIEYTFAASTKPANVVFSLQPSAPGLYHLSLHSSGSAPLDFKIFVMP